MQVILTVTLTLAVVMAAVDPRSRWCRTKCESLHDTDCADEDQCPESFSEEAEDDSHEENSICVNPCWELKESCTSSCYEAYALCQAGCGDDKPNTQSPNCFQPCFDYKFESLQQAPSR